MIHSYVNIKSLGVISNPAAGKGKEAIGEVTRKAVEKFNGCHIIFPEKEGKEYLAAAVLYLSSEVDAILVVGGDGTMSDVAFNLFILDLTIPIIGIGAGSTNAGPLISFKADRLDDLDPAALMEVEVGGMQASLNGVMVGLGFNDVVLGDTVLTTVLGQLIQVSAKEFMHGKKQPAVPGMAGTIHSEVRIKRPGGTIIVHRGEFGQLFAAPLEARYKGKGLAGGTSLAAALGLPAGIAITSQPIINFSIGKEGLLALEPITTTTASLMEEDLVFITGLRQGTCLNVDGNPGSVLGPEDEVCIRYVPAAARVLLPGKLS